LSSSSWDRTSWGDCLFTRQLEARAGASRLSSREYYGGNRSTMIRLRSPRPAGSRLAAAALLFSAFLLFARAGVARRATSSGLRTVVSDTVKVSGVSVRQDQIVMFANTFWLHHLAAPCSPSLFHLARCHVDNIDMRAGSEHNLSGFLPT